VTLPPAGSTASVTAVAGTVALRDSAGRSQMSAGVASADIAIVSQLPNPNLLRNGTFRTNQHAYVTNTDLALNAYGFDGWKATTSNSRMTFTAAPQGQVVTIPAGDSWGQVIERADINAGAHTVSHAGTAQARIYNVGASAPAYAACPVTATLDGTADVIVEFGPGTVDKAKVERGSIATPFVLDTINAELARCQRHYYLHASGFSYYVSTGFMYTAVAMYSIFPLPVTMRAAPSLIATSGTNYYAFDRAGSADLFNSLTAASLTPQTVSFYNATEISGTAGQAGIVYLNNASARIALSAEL
jgi:hypothetical protein